MKRINIFALALLISASFSSCRKDDSSSDNNNTNTSTGAVATSGTWRVTLFKEDDRDQTGHFSGYTFSFNPNGAVTAVSGGTTHTGTWSSGYDNSTRKLILNFSTSPLSELNEDWHVISESGSRMELKHVSGGDGSVDYLTFQKQ
jgi:hypothetical protein